MTLTSHDIRAMLRALRKIDEYHNVTPVSVRPATIDMEYWRAKGAADEIRETLLRVAIGDVEVETDRIVCDVDDLVAPRPPLHEAAG